MKSESDEVKNNQDRRKRFLTMSKIMFEIIAMVFQGVKALVLNLPSRTTTRGHFHDIAFVNRKVGDETVSICHLAILIENFHLHPINLHGVLAIA